MPDAKDLPAMHGPNRKRSVLGSFREVRRLGQQTTDACLDALAARGGIEKDRAVA